MRILLVEDEGGIQEIVAAGLGFHGHTVAVAGTHCEALAFLSARRFDAAIIDGSFPGKRGGPVTVLGLALARHCRELGLPTILFSADPSLVQHERDRGFAGVQTPGSLPELLMALAQITGAAK